MAVQKTPTIVKAKSSTNEKGGCKQESQSSPKITTRRKIRGKVIIRKQLCKGCGFCITFCPRHTLVLSKNLNEKGYHYPEIDKDNCTGCDLCGMICPDFAIYGFRIKNNN